MRLSISRHFALLFSVGVGVLTLVSSSLYSQARLQLDKRNIDAGTIYSGDIYKAQWTIKNTGNDTLVIQNLTTSCGCTSVNNLKPALAPGDFDFLKVEFNSSSFHGKITKSVSFTTNDPSQTSVVMQLTAEVIRELAPIDNVELLYLGSVPLQKEINRSFILKNISDKAITIKRVTCSTTDFRSDIRNTTVKPAGTISIPVIIMPTRRGFVNEKAFVETDSKRIPTVQFQVSYIGE